MTKSPVNESSMASSIESVIEAATIVMRPTRPTPIISAAAVDDGPLRVAQGVLAGQPAGHAPEAGDRPADDPGRPGRPAPARAR